VKYAIALCAMLAGCGGGQSDDQPPPRIQLFGDSTMRTAAVLWQERWGTRIENRAKDGTGSSYSNRNTPLTIDQYKANLRILAKAPGATAIFQTPNPSTLPGRDMAPYAQAMREVAAEFGLRVIDVFTCFQTQPNWVERIPDGTHPDELGLRYIVNICAAPVIESLG
jgi:lysophospholipase L1-like esterase